MRAPQVSERIKEAPAQALRGVFAGIGQLLLYTDKLRNKAPYPHVPAAPPAAAPRPEPEEPVQDRATASAPAEPDVVAEPATTQTPETPKASRAPKTPPAPKSSTPATEIRDFDKTGNVRLITADEARQDDEPEPTVAAAEAHAPASVEAPEPPASPLPNYDELSLASLRARLKNLDVTQLRGLIDYEKGHAGRADVLVMFERRIAKLEAGE